MVRGARRKLSPRAVRYGWGRGGAQRPRGSFRQSGGGGWDPVRTQLARRRRRTPCFPGRRRVPGSSTTDGVAAAAGRKLSRGTLPTYRQPKDCRFGGSLPGSIPAPVGASGAVGAYSRLPYSGYLRPTAEPGVPSRAPGTEDLNPHLRRQHDRRTPSPRPAPAPTTRRQPWSSTRSTSSTGTVRPAPVP